MILIEYKQNLVPSSPFSLTMFGRLEMKEKKRREEKAEFVEAVEQHKTNCSFQIQ
jgi:hypothetical protein